MSRYFLIAFLLGGLTACQTTPAEAPPPAPEPTATRRVQMVVMATPTPRSTPLDAPSATPPVVAPVLASPTPADETLSRPTPLASASPTPSSQTKIMPATATTSRVESRRFESQALGRSMDYLIYLPPGYDEHTTLRYPVLYMLHGAGDDNGPSVEEWWNLGLMDLADTYIEQGRIQPLLIVLPQGDQGYWMDHANNGPQYGIYLAQDVVREIDTHFRTVTDAQYRAVGGLSMGGDGALQLALNYPEVFKIAGAHSPTLPRPGFAPDFYGDRAYYDRFDPIALAQTRPDVAQSLLLWVDVGTDDPRLVNAEEFHHLLLGLGVAHEWRTFPGEHHWNYWLANVGDYLLYYASVLGTPRG